MTYSDEEILRRLRLGEDSAWEFKNSSNSVGDRPTSPRRGDWADEITSPSPTQAAAALLCGVSDDGDVQGMSRAADHQPGRASGRSLHRFDSSRRYASAPIIANSLAADLILVVEVPQGDSLHEGPGGAYIRVGASKRLMTSDERMRLAQRRGQARFRWYRRAACVGHGIAAHLDEDLWKPLSQFGRGRGRP